MSFSNREFKRRFDRAQKLVAESKSDVLLATAIENTEYFCAGAGLDNAWYTQFASSIAFPTIVIIPESGEPTVVVHNSFSRVVEQAIGGLCDIRTYFEVGPNEQQPYIHLVVERVRELGADDGSIGIELGAGHTTDPKIGVPLKNFLAIQDALPKAEFIDGSEILRRLRMIKSEAEINAIKQATEAIDQTFKTCFDELEVGMTEAEVVNVCNRLVSENGARPVWTLVSTTPGAVLPQSGERLEEGDTVFLDIGATVGGYHSDYNRMATVGSASQSQKNRCQTITEITEIVVDAIEPGVTPAQVVDICMEEFGRRDIETSPGVSSPTKIGHSIGLTLSEAPQVTGYDQTILEPGMVLCIEPAILAEDGKYVNEQIVVVSEDGSEVISKADTRLYQIS